MAASNDTKDGSVERVAFDLMRTIADQEAPHSTEKAKDPRRYYFELYWQSLQIASGENVNEVLNSEPEEK